jgi:hypothetical protein
MGRHLDQARRLAVSETRDAFGPLLEKLQAEMRGLRADVRALREEMGGMASRAYISARAEETETFINGLFETLNRRLDQTERSVEERLVRIEQHLAHGGGDAAPDGGR